MKERRLGGGTTQTVRPLEKEVHDVLDDQTRRGMFTRLPEDEARAKYPHLVIASLGANRKDRPNGEVTARVLHHGTNGLAVDTKTRLRDQERRGLRTFALTADVKEAHRQIPIDPRGWHSGNLRDHICIVLLVQSCLSAWPVDAVPRG